jgi:hypothetical protein
MIPNMNRIQSALQSKSPSPSLSQLALDIRDGKQVPLETDEYKTILGTLQSPATAAEIRRDLLEVSLLDRGSNDDLIAYCKDLLNRTSAKPGFSGYEGGADLALQCLLLKSHDKDAWVKRFEKSNSAVLRMAVAEHVARFDKQQGLLMMIEMIPLLGIGDHTVADAIDLWLSHEANPKLLAAVDSRLNDLIKKDPKSPLTAAFRHARKIIANP